VNALAGTLPAEAAKQKLQPRDRDVYIVSRRSRAHGTTAGVVSIAALKLAAQRIIDGTHELATDEQIGAYQAEQRKTREQLLNEANRARQTVSFVPPVNGGAR